MDRLDRVHSQYQQQHIYAQLEEIADILERTMLQTVIASELLGTDVSISDEAKSRVADARSRLQDETAEEEIDADYTDDLEEVVDEEEARVENEIHNARVQQAKTAEAMKRLNDELELVDQARLAGLVTLLQDWNWESQVYIDEATTYEERQKEAEAFGTEMREVFDEARAQIGDEFEGTTIESLVETLLASESLTVSKLDSKEWQALAESELGNHLAVRLG